jgi:hypothetical protein
VSPQFAVGAEQQITVSGNVFDSGGGNNTSGYSDFGTRRPGATGDTSFIVAADAPLVQIPGTGTIFKICPK